MKSAVMRLTARSVRSLVWDGEELVDWVSGGTRFGLDGSIVHARTHYAYPFDRAVSLAGSGHAVLTASRGTKGLVLREGKIVREIDRSHYFAHTYDYPAVMFRLASGREVLAHCPESYRQLEIEDLATGERLTRRAGRQPIDIFHSRLRASADGRSLVSAGFVWHPLDFVCMYDVEQALAEPTHLDGRGAIEPVQAEESSAAFLGDGRLAVAWRGDLEAHAADHPGELRIYGAGGAGGLLPISPMQRLGTLHGSGPDHLLALHDCPRLIEASTGAELMRWPDLKSGFRVSSLELRPTLEQPIAVDSARQRFAIADSDGITVVSVAS